MGTPNGPGGSAAGLVPAERWRVVLLFATIGTVTLAGFAASVVIGQRYALLGGLALVAYVFGLRHGVDADHIAAIDNTTRKLLHDGRRPLTVGTWFSLGHSTVVVALIVALVFATRTVASAIPAMQTAGTVIGALVSGSFLWIIGLLNVVVLLEVYRIFRGVRAGQLDEQRLEAELLQRGFLNRYFGRLFRLVGPPWRMYPIGLLFGLGFDTASEVALIAISVGVGLTTGIPLWMVLVLPLMFTCGMVLVDTADGVAMRLAYGWAFLKPLRKVYYNLTISVMSVLVALAMGTVELLQVLSITLGWSAGPWSVLGLLDFQTLGYLVIGIFVVAWLVSVAIYRYKGYERLDHPPEGLPRSAEPGEGG